MSRKPQNNCRFCLQLTSLTLLWLLASAHNIPRSFGVDSFLIIIIIITIIICVKRTFLHKYNRSHLRFVNLIIVKIINKIVQTLALLF